MLKRSDCAWSTFSYCTIWINLRLHVPIADIGHIHVRIWVHINHVITVLRLHRLRQVVSINTSNKRTICAQPSSSHAIASDSGASLRQVESLQDHDAAQENDPGLSAENKEQQSEPCVSHPSTVKSADEAPAREQPSEAAHKSAPEESINVAKATEPKDNVAQGVCVSVEAEQSLQPRERKLKPAFKKPTKTAIQQEERATEKPIAEESAPGGRVDPKALQGSCSRELWGEVAT